MKGEKYITVYDWMLQLGLTSSELLAFALVYRYSSHGQKLTASSENYAQWLGLHPTSAWRIMDKLCKKGLIYKTDIYNGSAHRCEYSVAPRFAIDKTSMAINKTSMAADNKTSMAAINKTSIKKENENKNIEKTSLWEIVYGTK